MISAGQNSRTVNSVATFDACEGKTHPVGCQYFYFTQQNSKQRSRTGAVQAGSGTVNKNKPRRLGIPIAQSEPNTSDLSGIGQFWSNKGPLIPVFVHVLSTNSCRIRLKRP